jgi:hypothetical protein
MRGKKTKGKNTIDQEANPIICCLCVCNGTYREKDSLFFIYFHLCTKKKETEQDESKIVLFFCAKKKHKN